MNNNEYMRNYRKTHKQKQYKKYIHKHPEVDPVIFDSILTNCLEKFSQSEIADYLGISRQVISLWKKKGLKFPKKMIYDKFIKIKNKEGNHE